LHASAVTPTPVTPTPVTRPPGSPSAAFSSSKEIALEACVAEAHGTEVPAASGVGDTGCDEPANREAEIPPADNFANRRGDEPAATGADAREAATLPGIAARPPANLKARDITSPAKEPTLTHRRQRALAKIEYYYGMAMNDERLEAQLAFLARWERGCFTAHEQSRDLREALAEYRWLLGRGPRESRRQVRETHAEHC
jgi:hypothetical protein